MEGFPPRTTIPYNESIPIDYTPIIGFKSRLYIRGCFRVTREMVNNISTNPVCQDLVSYIFISIAVFENFTNIILLDKQVYFRETSLEEQNRDVIIEKKKNGKSKPHKNDSLIYKTIDANITIFDNLTQDTKGISEDQVIFLLKLISTFGNWYIRRSNDRLELRDFTNVLDCLKQSFREQAKKKNIQQIKDNSEPLSNYVYCIDKENYKNYYEIRKHNGKSLWLHRNPDLSIGKIIV